MAKRGAKTKYTPELQAKLCEILSSGNYIEAACAYVGISKDTFYDWKEKFPQFSDAVEKARSGAEIASVARIRKSPVLPASPGAAGCGEGTPLP